MIRELIRLVMENGRLGLLYAIAFLIALVFALVLHEISHGLVALWNGDPTAKLYGRLSLNPLKHFDVVGIIMMLVVGFGWAKPVPVDPRNYKNYKRGSITVAIAGVTTNILLAFIFAMPSVILYKIPISITQNEAVYYVVHFFYFLSSIMVQLNISLALFNLLPLYPLDGYRLIASFVNENNGIMRFMRRYSLYIMLGLIALDMIPYVQAYSPFNWYIGYVGGKIEWVFEAFWRLIF